MTQNSKKIIFFGNGPLAEYSLAVLKKYFDVVFHAKTRDDLETVRELKQKSPEIHGILASFGVIIKPDLLKLFEPTGILNIHPSLLPKYRGASPIESAILDGATDFSVSIMKLANKMDAGPIYYQAALTSQEIATKTKTDLISGLIPNKLAIYQALAESGANWLSEHLANLPTPATQDDQKATFCGKLDKSMSTLTPETDTAEQTLRKIIAFAGYPKPKYTFYDLECIILEAHILSTGETALLPLPCADGQILSIDRLQPAGKNPMDAKSFLNGYKH